MEVYLQKYLEYMGSDLINWLILLELNNWETVEVRKWDLVERVG